MFSFLNFFGTKDPWSTPRAMEKWLTHLPKSDPMQAQAAVVNLLDDYLRSDESHNLTSMPALCVLNEHIEPLLQELLEHYLRNHKTSINVERLTWKTIFDLAKKIDQAYEPILDYEPEYLLKILKREGTSKSIGYYIRNKNLQAKIRLFRFEQWVPAQWSLLHKSFLLAEKAKVLDCPIKLSRFEENIELPITTTIENEYVQLLLLQLLNVGSFTPSQIQHAHMWLLMNASDLKAERLVQAEGFIVDTLSSEGLHRLSSQLPQVLNGQKDNLRFINTYAIIQILSNEIQTTESITNEVEVSHPLHEHIQLHQKWYGLWNHNQFKWSRNGEREKRTDSTLWVVDSWQAMHQCLPPIEGGSSSMVVPTPISHIGEEYQVLDHSQSGYGLIGLVNESRPFRLSMLLLIFDPTNNIWSLGVLRRLKKLNADQAEMGIELLGEHICTMQPTQTIQELSSTSEQIEVYEYDSEKNRQTNFAHTTGEIVLTLYMKAQENTKAGNQPSLFIAKKDYFSGKNMYLQLEMGLFKIELHSIIEEGYDWIWCGFTAQHHAIS